MYLSFFVSTEVGNAEQVRVSESHILIYLLSEA